MRDVTVRITDLPADQRPRERLNKLGADRLSPAELIAILLRTGRGGRSALEIANELMAQFGSIQGLARASVDDLREIKGIGRAKAAQLKAAFELAARASREPHEALPIRGPGDAANVVRESMRDYEVEQFHVLLLDTKNRLIREVRAGKGTLNASLVHPRETFRDAIKAGAAAVILIHNHPSGDPTPSSDDIKITREMVEAGRTVKIEVFDHVIIGKRTPGRAEDYVSLKEMGLL